MTFPCTLSGEKLINVNGLVAHQPDDTPSVARDLAQGLSFAEQVVSEANSVIVILDRQGNIQRFNRLCEEYTGLREREVIGQSVFTLFMSRREAAASRRNIDVFS